MFGLKTILFGGHPALHRQEIGGGWGGYTKSDMHGVAAGLVAGTWVATAIGWRPAEAIAKGDLVLTFDRGLRPVREVTRGRLWSSDDRCPRILWPLRVPAGALGNQQEMTVLPEQSVMLESDAADLLYGDPFTLVRAADLDGFRGIERVVPETVALDVIQLHFDEDEIVFANAGALVHCPSAQGLEIATLDGACKATGYEVLTCDEAALLLECLRDEDAVAGDWTPANTPASQVLPGYAAVFS
ncbi:MAG: Hint domain-containing protein [Rhodobacter sp.]|nr:Hint domain-containing protein [Rhodobacter sp.]